MTKAWEHGENEIVDQARREAARTGRDIGEILNEMLKSAKLARDTARRIRIERAQKFLKLRNTRKRRGKQ
jgi:hypothetical protein